MRLTHICFGICIFLLFILSTVYFLVEASVPFRNSKSFIRQNESIKTWFNGDLKQPILLMARYYSGKWGKRIHFFILVRSEHKNEVIDVKLRYKDNDWQIFMCDRLDHEVCDSRAIRPINLKAPKSPQAAYYWRGITYWENGQLEKAIKNMQKAIELNPDHFNAIQHLHWFYRDKNKLSKILPYWNQFIKRHPDYGKAYTGRGQSLMASGKNLQAISDLAISCQLADKKGCDLYEQFEHQ